MRCDKFCCVYNQGACVPLTKMATARANSSQQSSPKKNGGIAWSCAATETLLELWAEECIRWSLEHAKSVKEMRGVYDVFRPLIVGDVWCVLNLKSDGKESHF